jgi:hypothetical protein
MDVEWEGDGRGMGGKWMGNGGGMDVEWAGDGSVALIP